MSETLKFKGKLDRVVYGGEGFKVYGMKVDRRIYKDLKINHFQNVTIVGDLPQLEYGVEYTIEGIEKENGKFGWQYVVSKIYREKPTSAEESKKFLEEVLTVRQAKILLEAYPDIVDRIINNEEVDLSKTKGIKEASFEKIKKRIIEDFCLMDLINDYAVYGMTLTMIRKLYVKYGSVDRVKEEMEKDPYNCLCQMNNVGFIKADAMILPIKPELTNSRQRCGSCMKFLVDENEVDGSTYIERRELFNKVYNLVGGDCAKHFDEVVMFDADLYVEGIKVANRKTYEAEKYIAMKIVELNENSVPLKIDWTNYTEFDGIKLVEEQCKALENVCKFKVSVLAGFAGAGKTQTTKAIINMLEDNGLTYELFAPTGRASQVLSEYTERPASTIHRGLGYGVNEIGQLAFGYNEDCPLPCDVLIVDEGSMIDVLLMRHLLRAVDVNHTRVLFVLDPKQLPSVGCGNVGFDMIESKLIPVTILTKIFRYGEGGLMQVATKIRNGESYATRDMRGIHNFGVKQDYSLIAVEQEVGVNYAINIFKTLLQKGTPIDEIIILTAMNKGDYGTLAMNKYIQDAINPATEWKGEIAFGNLLFREGDRVIQTRNNYKAPTDVEDKVTQIFNGNIGTVKKIYNKTMVVEFDNVNIVYEGDALGQLLLGYCITIHKSQGSAFKHVILLNPKSHIFFLNRNLLYVGVTRAKERVYHITTPEVIYMALKEEATFTRSTFLKTSMLEIKNLVDKGEIKWYNESIKDNEEMEDEEEDEDREIFI